jgi:hypothetical protein
MYVALPRRSTLKLVRQPQAKLHLRVLGVYQRIILKLTLENCRARIWIAMSWLGMRSGSWLCEHNYEIVEFRYLLTSHKYMLLTASEDLLHYAVSLVY